MENQSHIDSPENNIHYSPVDQPTISSVNKTNLWVPILITFLVNAVIFGLSGYYFGKQSATSSQVDQYQKLVPIQTVSPSPASTYSNSPTISDAMIGWQTYNSTDNKLAFKVPANTNVAVKEGSIEIKFGNGESPDYLFVAYTSNDNSNLPGYSGTAAGDPMESGQIDFLGSKIRKVKLVLEDKTTEVFYGGSPGARNIVTKDQFKFIITLNWGLDSKNGIPTATEILADQILSTFEITN